MRVHGWYCSYCCPVCNYAEQKPEPQKAKEKTAGK
jgi:hypothetical protein